MLQTHALRAHIQVFFFKGPSAYMSDVSDSWIENWLMTSFEALWGRTFLKHENNKNIQWYVLLRGEGGTQDCVFSATTGRLQMMASIRVYELTSARTNHLITCERNVSWSLGKITFSCFSNAKPSRCSCRYSCIIFGPEMNNTPA